jgi:hypothetical protein
MQIMQTQGGNYDITNEQIVLQVKEWEAKWGLDLVVIDMDRIEGPLKVLPEDIESFTEVVYQLCPDVIDQGYGDMEAMISDYKQNQYFWMWWD